MACIFYQEGMDEKRRKEDAGRIKYIVAGHNHSIPARELEEPNRRCGKSCYHWSRGLSSSSSARPEGRHPANKKIHERCIICRFHEFFPVVWIAI